MPATATVPPPAADRAGPQPYPTPIAVFWPEMASLVESARSHDVEIKGEDGRVLFTQDRVRAPGRWTPRAVQVAASKYLYGDPARADLPVEEGGRERSIFQLHRRVARFIADRGVTLGHFDADGGDFFARELMALTLGQYAAFNSPVWFNVGLDSYGLAGDDDAWAWDPEALRPFEDGEAMTFGHPLDGQRARRGDVRKVRDTYFKPQGSACFIQSVRDDLRSIMDLATQEAMLFKYGSGSGTDLSTLRSRKEKLSGGGTPSGPLSFMRVYDTVASVIKSGGKTRRAAKMQTLHAGHPDVLDFIRAKGIEEKKAQALIAQGYDANFNGEAYSSVSFQNANFSVRVPDAFMRKLDEPGGTTGLLRSWPLRAVTTGEVIETTTVDAIWDAIAEETWRCGDPAVQFCDTINRWHTTPRGMDGGPTPINSSNPCSEYLSIDDSACNLASLNLMRFVRDDGTFDVVRFVAAIQLMIRAMEILVDACSYPTRAIARNAHNYRQLGLGFANLGGLLQSQGLAYDSEEARVVAGSIASILGGTAYAESARLARELGPFPAFEINRDAMLDVIAMHHDAASALAFRADPEFRAFRPRSAIGRQADALADAGYLAWSVAYARGASNGYRNAQTTVIAPTGTIAFTMDCDTTGIEPNLALVAKKTLAGGGTMAVANRLVPMALGALGYDDDDAARIARYVADHGTAEGCPDLRPDHVGVFDTSFAPPGYSRVIDFRAHLLMMAEVQRFVSGAISKTVNVPSDFTVEEIADVYREAWRLGIKCVAVYRDGSKGSQPLEAVGREARVKCVQCGHEALQPTGTCSICPQCGTPQGGCS